MNPSPRTRATAFASSGSRAVTVRRTPPRIGSVFAASPVMASSSAACGTTMAWMACSVRQLPITSITSPPDAGLAAAALRGRGRAPRWRLAPGPPRRRRPAAPGPRPARRSAPWRRAPRAPKLTLGQDPRGPRARDPRLPLRELGWPGARDEVGERRLRPPDAGLGLGDGGLRRAHRGLLSGDLAALLRIVQPDQHLAGGDRIPLVDKHRVEAARDLATDLDGDLRLHGAHALNRRPEVPLRDLGDRHRRRAEEEVAGHAAGRGQQRQEREPREGGRPASARPWTGHSGWPPAVTGRTAGHSGALRGQGFGRGGVGARGHRLLRVQAGSTARTNRATWGNASRTEGYVSIDARGPPAAGPPVRRGCPSSGRTARDPPSRADPRCRSVGSARCPLPRCSRSPPLTP